MCSRMNNNVYIIFPPQKQKLPAPFSIPVFLERRRLLHVPFFSLAAHLEGAFFLATVLNRVSYHFNLHLPGNA